MKILLFFLVLILVFDKAMATDKVMLALDQYAWEKRQLIVFSPNADNHQYQLFKKVQIEYSEALEERNLHTWHIVGDNKVTLNSIITDDVNSQDFREAFDINEDEFALLLIGYDRDVKIKQKQINMKYLFSKIDQMPIRLQEMRDNKSN